MMSEKLFAYILLVEILRWRKGAEEFSLYLFVTTSVNYINKQFYDLHKIFPWKIGFMNNRDLWV